MFLPGLSDRSQDTAGETHDIIERVYQSGLGLFLLDPVGVSVGMPIEVAIRVTIGLSMTIQLQAAKCGSGFVDRLSKRNSHRCTVFRVFRYVV